MHYTNLTPSRNAGLSTCLGEPLRLLISHLWERLLEYADGQPAPSSSGNMKWSRREGNQFNVPYTRLGRGSREQPRRFGMGMNQNNGREEEEEMELLDWKREYRTRQGRP